MRHLPALLLAAVMMPLPARAMEAPAGASTCSGCHGHGGIVAINGRDPKAMVAMMEAFRSGARPATLMNRLVRGFSPAEVQAIADWLAVQP